MAEQNSGSMRQIEDEVRGKFVEGAYILSELTGQDPEKVLDTAWDNLKPTEISLSDTPGELSRFVSGPEDKTAYGGTRAHDYKDVRTFRADGARLAIGMQEKLLLADIDESGGKTIRNRNYRPLSFEEMEEDIRNIQRGMQNTGQSSHERHKPAPDVGTSVMSPDGSHNLMDTYAMAHRENNPEDPYWQAVISGKYEHGGVGFREYSTGRGTHEAAEHVRIKLGLDQADTAIIGFGNVGGEHARSASSNENMRVNMVSDFDGTLVLHDPRDPRGIFIDEWMFDNIANNGNFANDPRFEQFGASKMRALQARLLQEHNISTDFVPDNTHILKAKTDILVPAALGGTIHEGNMHEVGKNCQAIVEAGNDALTPEAVHYLQSEILYYPAGAANFGGVIISDEERSANIAAAEGRPYDTSTERMQAVTREKILGTAHAIDKIIERMGKQGMNIGPHQAASVLILARMGIGSLEVEFAS